MRNPYDVLGVGRQADEAAVKSAFRKLAKQYHPDRNASDPKAKERFAEVNNAYEILGDKDKRGKFDRGEIDAEGKPKFQGFEGFSGGSPFGQSGGPGFHGGFGGRGGGQAQDDILSEILRGFGGAGPQSRGGPRQAPPGRDITGEVSVTLEEVAAGTTKRVALPGGRHLEVSIPAWIGDGKSIRLAGQGEPGAMGGRPGDVLLTIRHLAHPRFVVEGADIRVRVAVPLADAVLGGDIRVPTLTGEVEMKLPAWTSGGRSFRLRGKGLSATAGRGDLIVGIDLVLPEGDEELAALMRRQRG